ncbi:MAG TPA: MFS transporter [Spirochaetia bacterium]|nr:MFS transporter [Spirochaetia bacterium]
MQRSNYRWVVIFLAALVTAINYIDRSSISFAILPLKTLLKLSPGEVGLILGAFSIGYAVMVFFGGIIVDFKGARLTWFWAALLWSVSIGATAFATGFAYLMIVRYVLGMSEGPNFPAMQRAVGDWLPSKERGVALGWGLMAVPFALMIGAPIVSQLTIHIGWQGMFIVLGVLGLIWAPLWYFFFRDFPEHAKGVNDAELAHIREGAYDRNRTPHEIRREQHERGRDIWKVVLTSPTLLANDWAFFVFGYNLFFFMTWLPSYLSKTYSMKLATVGYFSMLPWGLATILLAIMGYVSDALLKRTGSLRVARSHPIWITQLISALCIFPVIYTRDLTTAIIFISLAVGFGMAANASFYAINADLARERTGTALGVMDLAFAIAGFVAPALTGYFVDSTGSFSNAFLLIFLLMASSVVVVFFFHKPDQELKKRALTT